MNNTLAVYYHTPKQPIDRNIIDISPSIQHTFQISRPDNISRKNRSKHFVKTQNKFEVISTWRIIVYVLSTFTNWESTIVVMFTSIFNATWRISLPDNVSVKFWIVKCYTQYHENMK